MNLSLQTKVTLFIAAVVLAVTSVSTLLFIAESKTSIEREIIGRGIALADALARSVDEGLASENLNLIKQYEEIVHTRDVVLTQVFSSLWLGVASVPVDELNLPPDPAAVLHFKNLQGRPGFFHLDRGSWIDIYSTILLDPHDARVPRILVGYVRLRISKEGIAEAVRSAVYTNVLAAALLTIAAVILLNTLMRKHVITPIMNLHRSMVKHKEGVYDEITSHRTGDEIGELSAEFNEMSRALREREERLADEKERLAVTLRSIGDGVIVTDVDGKVTLMNRIAEQHTAWSAGEAVGRKLQEVFDIISEKTGERCANPVDKVMSSGLICGLANHTALVKRDGTRIAIEDSAAPILDRNSGIIGVVLVFRDVTEKRHIEEELIKAEKLQSVGLLAGGLAHDFNNLLTSIVGNISMAKMYIDARSKAQIRLNEAETASRRATDLTYQLLTFSKGGAPVRKAITITDIIKESSSFALSGTSVAPEFVTDDCIWNVDVDAGQMSQVFNNLIINAVQAMPEGGMIRFFVSNRTLGANDVPTLSEGAYVRISVQDSGTGISPEHLSRIFDPYFTTKKNGSGLGLASVYSIIKRHDGHITVDSKPGHGTAFDIYLPASRNAAAGSERPEGGISRGQGKVLIMDDEKLVRDVAVEMLCTLGYAVETAVNGSEAIEMYRSALESKEPYAIVIMDLTIPGDIGGRETVRKLRTFDPEVKAIVSSGYSNDPIMADYAHYGFMGVITKPYSIESFSTVLTRVMKM